MAIETKSIRFSDDEKYLLDHIEGTGKRFSSYIKDLIIADIKGVTAPVNFDVKAMIKDALMNDAELKEMIREIINEDDKNLAIEKVETISEEKNDLLNFMN